MIHKDDRMITMRLYDSWNSDRVFQRPDMTTYVCRIRKGQPNSFYTPESQLELNLKYNG